MDQAAMLQGTEVMTSLATEEVGSIVAVEGQATHVTIKTLIIATALTKTTTTILVEGVEQGIMVTTKVPFVEDAIRGTMEDTIRMNSNHVKMLLRNLT